MTAGPTSFAESGIVLGQKYRDSITGAEGTATSRTEFLYGCVRVCLERVDKDGKIQTEYFDEQRLLTIDTGASAGFKGAPVASPATSGGPGEAPPARSVPPAREAR